MNVNYKQELHDSINNSNDQLIQTENKLDQAKSTAKLSLNYAQKNAEKNEIIFRAAKVINDQSLSLDVKCVAAVNLANNALTAAKQYLIDSDRATSSVSIAAANIQIAANSITKLSSDVAGILAVLTAADYGSKIQESVEKAHVKMKKAAEMAEDLSLISLQATVEAAKSTASKVVSDAEQALAAMTSLETAASSQSDNSSEQVKAAHAGLMAALKTEKYASATYDIVVGKDQALKSTRKLINQVSNQLTESNQDHSGKLLVDADKATTIDNLKRLAEDAKLSLIEAEAAYESFQAKSVLFDLLLNNAVDRLTVMTDQNKLAVDVSQKVNSLSESVKTALQTANDTYSDACNLLISVQQVVDTTLDAATEITLSAELIMKRKASNPLISSDLVTQASQAATDANKAVSLIINALTSSYNALSATSQANNTGEIVLAEVICLKDLVEGATPILANTAEDKMPIESQVNVYFAEARSTERASRHASDRVQKSVIKRKNKLTNATAKLANAEASLHSAMELQKPLG